MVKLLVGLTGGFGSGKSTVLKLFGELGAKTLDCDALVKKCWRPGHVLYPGLARLVKQQGITLAEVKGEAFRNRSFRRKLENIIHPWIFKRIRLAQRLETGILVTEVPLLFETGFNRETDFVITVNTSSKKSRTRTGKSRGISQVEWEARSKAQWPLERKIKKSDSVIKNDGSLAGTRRQVRTIWKEINSMSATKKEKKTNGR